MMDCLRIQGGRHHATSKIFTRCSLHISRLAISKAVGNDAYPNLPYSTMSAQFFYSPQGSIVTFKMFVDGRLQWIADYIEQRWFFSKCMAFTTGSLPPRACKSLAALPHHKIWMGDDGRIPMNWMKSKLGIGMQHQT